MIEDQIFQARLDSARRVIKNSKREIWITTSFEGIHSYPDALLNDELEDVKFLSYPHRHIFHLKVGIEVFHNDRDIEFIQFKRFVDGMYKGGSSILELNNQSCEMIADSLYEQIAVKYPNRDVSISVSEDNENGCVIDYKKEVG